MSVTVIFLGKLADLAPAPEMELAAPLDWAELLDGVPEALREAIDNETTKLAVNGELLADKSALAAKSGDEVALLPPVSGG